VALHQRCISIEITASLQWWLVLQLRQFCTGVCVERTWAHEVEESPMLEAVTRERLVKTQQVEKVLAGAVVICELWKLAVALSLLELTSRVYIYLSIYSCCSHFEHRVSVKHFVSLQFLNLRQLVGLLGRGISPSQGCYLHRITQTQNKRS
jgi:hypothetical protein